MIDKLSSEYWSVSLSKPHLSPQFSTRFRMQHVSGGKAVDPEEAHSSAWCAVARCPPERPAAERWHKASDGATPAR